MVQEEEVEIPGTWPRAAYRRLPRSPGSPSPGDGPGSGEIEKLLELDPCVARHATERRRTEPNGIVIRERQLPALGVAVDAVRAPLSNEHESCTLEGTKHPARR